MCGMALFYMIMRPFIDFYRGSPAPDELPKAKVRHVTSSEWLTRETQDFNFLNDESRRVTAYRNDFQGSVWTAELDFWGKVQRNEWEPATFKIIKHFLDGHSDASYIDFGAWIGPTVLLQPSTPSMYMP